MKCSECPAEVQRNRTGRPRKTCTSQCAMARDRRLAIETNEAQSAEATRWWLSLTRDQRESAMVYVRTEPPPAGFRGGRQLWAYFSRAAFSCEQRVVSGVR